MSPMFTIPEPATDQQIAATLERVQDESVAYWSGFETSEFFAKIDGHWSPAENVRHLIKSIRPVTKALTMPRLVLWFMFGNAPQSDLVPKSRPDTSACSTPAEKRAASRPRSVRSPTSKPAARGSWASSSRSIATSAQPS